MKHTTKGNLILFLTALIWGCSFVSQSVGMDYIGPNTFMGIRTVMGGLVLLPVIALRDRAKKRNGTYQKPDTKKLITYGAICGVFLCIASTLQTYGLKYTTTAKSGFLTALYIIFVAVFGLFLKKKQSKNVWLGITFALTGMYFLCLFGTDLSFNIGDLYTIACAVFFTGQILCIDAFVHRVDAIKLSCVQFLISGSINLILMFFLERPDLASILACGGALLYSGVCSCGIAYTLQVIGQKYSNPTSASIIMSFESVFAALAGWVLLSESLSLPQLAGCALLFFAILLVQSPVKDTAGL